MASPSNTLGNPWPPLSIHPWAAIQSPFVKVIFFSHEKSLRPLNQARISGGIQRGSRDITCPVGGQPLALNVTVWRSLAIPYWTPMKYGHAPLRLKSPFFRNNCEGNQSPAQTPPSSQAMMTATPDLTCQVGRGWPSKSRPQTNRFVIFR
jgi:hypothetical protein